MTTSFVSLKFDQSGHLSLTLTGNEVVEVESGIIITHHHYSLTSSSLLQHLVHILVPRYDH